MKSERISLATAKLLKEEKSYKENSDAFYTEYLVNQKDLEYPEGGGPFSMSKGEITFDMGYFVNNNRGYGDFSNNNYISYGAPQQALLQRWFREKHGLILWVEYAGVEGSKWVYVIYDKVRVFAGNSYEECLEAGLETALKLIK
jgi:hypothetical protein